ncbi:MAG: hypothetical protein KKG35_10485 [Proteobacteria bacterium]|nr:hypothetical protein [Pseudomonadota bacterium]
MNEVETDNPSLADELLIVRHSGEIPEVALHGSLYYLTRAADGPGLELRAREIRALQAMVVERYREIIRRDLDPGNRDLGLYRGVMRASVNWRRLTCFCRKEGWVLEAYRREVAQALLVFLANEIAETRTGARSSAINCGSGELRDFARELGLAPADLPAGWLGLCPAPER